MIVRQAFFEGTIHPGREAEFRHFVETRLLPMWRRFPGVRDLRVLFATRARRRRPALPAVAGDDLRRPGGARRSPRGTDPPREPGRHRRADADVRRAHPPPRVRGDGLGGSLIARRSGCGWAAPTAPDASASLIRAALERRRSQPSPIVSRYPCRYSRSASLTRSMPFIARCHSGTIAGGRPAFSMRLA